MDHYAADVSAVVEHLDLHNAVHVGTPPAAAGRTLRRPLWSAAGRVAKAVAPSRRMVKTEQNPGGTPIEVFDGFRSAGGEPRPVLSRRRLWPVLWLQS